MEKGLILTQELGLYITQNRDISERPDFYDDLKQAVNYFTELFRDAMKHNSKETFRKVFQTIDENMASIPSENMAQLKCKKGCSFCCKINVDISEEEAQLILEFCEENGISIDPSYLEEQLKFTTHDLLFSPVAKCAFLKNDLCSIYDVRPIACRKYLVGTDPKYCNAVEYPPPENKVGVYFDMRTELLLSGLIPLLKPTGRMPGMLLKYIKREL